MPNIAKLMKEAARAQQQLQEVQASLATRTVEASSGGGAVKVVARCDGSLVSIKIDPAAVTPGDAAMLEDMVLTAANQALEQGRKISAEEMGRVTQGLGLPGM